jgi:hypothetical protein
MAVAFDAQAMSVVNSTEANTLTTSHSHTAASGASGIVAVVNSNNGSNGGFTPTGTPTASFGATSMTWLGHVTMGASTNNYGFIAVWSALTVPSGAQTVSTSIASAGNTNGNAYGVSFTYTGVGSIGTLQTNRNVSAAPSLSVTSAVGSLVWGLIGNWWSDSLTSFSLTSRRYQNAGTPYFIGGDAAGATSVTVSATQGATREWAVTGLDIQPPVATDTKQFFAML